MRSDIFVRHLHGTGTNLTNDRYSDLDPAWSPDEQLIVYVSDRPDSPEMR
jgi:Tol biopolymer transport system component